MIPLGRLSTTPVPADFQHPDSIEPDTSLIDYELGGVALNDPSQGLQVLVWTCTAAPDGNIYLSTPGQPEILVFTAEGTTEVSLAFDQNMRPFIAYVQNGQAKFRWYDTVLGANRITDLGLTDRNPRCCMDDKRGNQTSLGTNDIILAYMRGDSLYYRQQRDRYEVEYLLQSGLQAKLLRIGMNKKYRLQFLLEATA